MKKNILKLLVLSSTLFFVSSLLAQSVSINTDGSSPNASALLDIKSIDKGLLIPRMTSAQRTAIITPANGLMVFDITTNSPWYYNGALWSQLSAGSNGWNLTGNTATNAITNFIGTTDNQPLRFRVNNLWAGEIHPGTGNIFMGVNAGNANTSGRANTALGISAFMNSTASSFNVAIGDSALFSQNGSIGNSNTAVGTHTLFSNIDGIANTAIGGYALYKTGTGDYNTAIGVNALSNNINGDENTAVGTRALQFNDQSFNTAIGAKALRFNTSGLSNTATGFQALYSNITSNYNTAMGVSALYSNSTGNENTAMGVSALYSNSTGNYNTAMGNHALVYNTTGNGNTATGHSALNYNISGSRNSALGDSSMLNNTTGNYNTVSGYQALYSNTTGSLNTATGYEALFKNISGDGNTAIGVEALFKNTTGTSNIAIGSKALFENINGTYNTAIGNAALSYNLGGSFNIAIGYNSGTELGSPSITNTISIGNNGYLNAASNQAFLGNPSTIWNGGNRTWSTYSDARMKNTIIEDVKGLDFILRLRPVTYHRSIKAVLAITGNKDIKDYPEKYDVEKIKETGFLAQEVEQAAKAAGYDFSGVGIPKKENQLYTLSYEQFVVPLVKAVQEQQQIIIAQQQQIDELKILIQKTLASNAQSIHVK